MNNIDLNNILDKRLDKDFLIQLFQEQKEVHSSAIQVALSNQQPQAWRSTWILNHCTSKNDKRIEPYISDFIKTISNQKDGHQREILKILNKMTLDDEQEGRLFDICMSIWEKLNKAPAVRYVSFLFIHKTCTKHPELEGELNFICQEQYLDTLSPGIQKIVKRIIKTGK